MGFQENGSAETEKKRGREKIRPPAEKDGRESPLLRWGAVKKEGPKSGKEQVALH